jgi:hypothetical protein
MVQFYKLLFTSLCHNGFTYKEGLNVDHVPFAPEGSCKPGGLYYTTLEHLSFYYIQEWPLVADVTLPDDAEIYAEPCGTKWKADRLVLNNIRPLSKLFATLDEATLGQMLAHNGMLLEHVHKQTEELCLVAVQHYSPALQFVQNKTDTICMAAVQKNGHTLQFVRNQTDAVCLAAVQECGSALEYVENQTEAICLAAVQSNGCALKYVHNQTDAICMTAVQQHAVALAYVHNQTEAICLAAVQHSGWALKYVLNQTEAVCRAAMEQDPAVKCFVKIPIDF